MQNKEIILNFEHLTLGQILKTVGLINTGGLAKHFLRENQTFVNGELESRRGRKIYADDLVKITGYYQIKLRKPTIAEKKNFEKILGEKQKNAEKIKNLNKKIKKKENFPQKNKFFPPTEC